MNLGEYGARLSNEPNRKDISLEQKNYEWIIICRQSLKTYYRRSQGTN